MVNPDNRDVRLEQISSGNREPTRPSDTIDAELWPAVAIGSAGFLAGIGSTDLPIIGGLFGGGGGGGGGIGTSTIVLLAVIMGALLIVATQL